jgi:hypothetical protein
MVMKVKDILGLKRGSWVSLRDGRTGVYNDFVPKDCEDGYPSVIVNVHNEGDSYSHDERFYPNQVKDKC